MTAKQTLDKIEILRAALPTWTIERYGNQGAIACYPPTAPNMFHFQDLNKVAFISSVCGLLYVVTHLRMTFIDTPQYLQAKAHHAAVVKANAQRVEEFNRAMNSATFWVMVSVFASLGATVCAVLLEFAS